MDVLEEIIQSRGDCLEVERCNRCPFWERCWYDMLHTHTPSQEFRQRLAEDALFHKVFFGGDLKWRADQRSNLSE